MLPLHPAALQLPFWLDKDQDDDNDDDDDDDDDDDGYDDDVDERPDGQGQAEQQSHLQDQGWRRGEDEGTWPGKSKTLF